MNGLEIVLIILVLTWSAIFLIIAIFLAVFFFQVKKGMDKINSILDNISIPLSKAVTGAEYLKDAIGSVIKIRRSRRNNKK